MVMDRKFYYRKMHVLLEHLGIEHSKQYLLEGYGVGHANELSDIDLEDIVNRLTSMLDAHAGRSAPELRRWRSILLSLLNKYGVYATNKDWSNVNRFLLNKKISGKLLYEMDIPEIQETCIRLRIIVSKREAIMKKNDRLAKLN